MRPQRELLQSTTRTSVADFICPSSCFVSYAGKSEGDRVKPHALSAGECGVGRKKRDETDRRKGKKRESSTTTLPHWIGAAFSC
ncbi:hypothetical protein NL676_027754 [Syzygium grande]|nr:hypothetical protein NL676_027754 [Syzygium grande]